MIEIILAVVSAATGFMIKSLWQAYVDKKADIDTSNRDKNIANLEDRLSHFYWPIYLRLQKDNVVWRKILDRTSEDDEKKKTGYEIEKSIILPNHEEIVKIIENNIHLARPDKELEEQILQYLKHVAIYQSIRNIGITDKDPIYFDEPWPQKLFALIETHTHKAQKEYDQLISNS